MLRPPSGPTEKPGSTAPRLAVKDSYLKCLGLGFARWLKQENAQLPMLAGESADAAKKMQWEVSEGLTPTIRPLLPQATAPDSGANDATQKRELDPLELSLSVALGGGQPGMLTPVGNTLHDASSGARPLVGGELALIEEVVRRISWGGDRRRGAARIELGGALVGTTIVVQGEGRTVALDIELGPGADAGTLPARLAARLAARGLEVRSVDVR
jgi:hypothetical protein